MRLPTLLLAAVVLPLAACQKPAPTEPTKPAEPTVTSTAPALSPNWSRNDFGMTSRPALSMVVFMATDYHLDGWT